MNKKFKPLLVMLLALSLLVCFSAVTWAEEVQVTNQGLKIDGNFISSDSYDVYNIDGANYFKLRGLAALLAGTRSQFEVDYQEDTHTMFVTTGKAYTKVGGELIAGVDKSKTCVPSDWALVVNGEKKDIQVYNIGGNNYFQLRGLGVLIGFKADYDEAARTMILETAAAASIPVTDKQLLMALGRWHGFKPIIDANRGIGDAKDGSIYKTLGLDMKITMMDDEAALQGFIKGNVVAIGMSVNRWPYVHGWLEEAGVSGKMVLITDRSIGGDGMVTTAANISTIEGLVGHTIAVAEHSVAHIITEWLLMNCSLTTEQINEIRKKMIFTESPSETYEKLASGQADVAYLGEPYLTMASNLPGTKTVFTTRTASNLNMTGIVFREDYMNHHPELVERFIEGALRAGNEMPTELRYIREVDDYVKLSDAEILAMSDYVAPANYAVNRDLFNGVVQSLYRGMAAVWEDLGERTVANGSQTGFDASYLLRLGPKFPNDTFTSGVTITDTDRNNAVAQANTEALLRQTLTINFEPNVAIIREESYDALQSFAKIAMLLNGAIIRVEGNVADTGVGDTAAGRLLSEQRAKAVCDYLVSLGINEKRLIYVGNGSTNPVPGLDPRSLAGMEANRRTDIFFLMVE